MERFGFQLFLIWINPEHSIGGFTAKKLSALGGEKDRPSRGAQNTRDSLLFFRGSRKNKAGKEDKMKYMLIGGRLQKIHGKYGKCPMGRPVTTFNCDFFEPEEAQKIHSGHPQHRPTVFFCGVGKGAKIICVGPCHSKGITCPGSWIRAPWGEKEATGWYQGTTRKLYKIILDGKWADATCPECGGEPLPRMKFPSGGTPTLTHYACKCGGVKDPPDTKYISIYQED